MTMKRYLILILLAILVLVLGVVVGCGQKQKQQEIKEYLDYLDKVNTVEINCFEAIAAVSKADDAALEVIKSRDEFRLLEVEAVMKKSTNEALDTVNSALSSVENLVPPPDARTLHRLMIESLQKSQKGLVKLSYGSAILYDKAYSMLHRSVPTKEYPDTSEAMRQGRQLLRESLDTWEQANAEMDNLFNVIKQKAKN